MDTYASTDENGDFFIEWLSIDYCWLVTSWRLIKKIVSREYNLLRYEFLIRFIITSAGEVFKFELFHRSNINKS